MRVGALSLGALFLVVCTSCASAQQVVPAMPAWAARLPVWTGHRNASFDYNRALVENANNLSATFDFVMWGDSLTSFALFVDQNAKVWSEYFGVERSGWSSARLGVGGSTVEELAWRIMAGGEKLKKDPLVALVWIGINNVNANEAAARLDGLLAWMQAAMPLTRLVVQAPPPQNWYPGRSAELLKAYRPMLNRRGVELSTCGSGLNPGPSPANYNTTTYMDGLHLLAPGYRTIFACLKPRLAALRAVQARKRGIALGAAGRR